LQWRFRGSQFEANLGKKLARSQLNKQAWHNGILL
jgi:hypothetical protein